MRGPESGASGPASATAGTARTISTNTDMEYVRFVSKRGTVARFQPLEGDRAHRAHICVRIHTSTGMNLGSQLNRLKEIMSVNAR
jgi:hypothetical protein